MRVIGGSAKGQKLKTIKNYKIRPTSSKVKEALFDILGNRIENRIGLDLFAGSGCLGIEAISRGASKITFIEKDKGGFYILRENLIRCGFKNHVYNIINTSVDRGINLLSRKNEKFSLVFLDPPYMQGLSEKTINLLISKDIIEEGAIIAVEHFYQEKLPSFKIIKTIKTRIYGETQITILERKE
jgi:16S rRNA (guanine(966)-N(2))-methyltransferase RsmD